MIKHMDWYPEKIFINLFSEKLLKRHEHFFIMQIKAIEKMNSNHWTKDIGESS